jgi:small GTP-binding protein
MPATIGAAFLTKVISTPNGQVRLQLWDTAGQEKFRSLAPMYYRSSAVAVLVYDITARSSLDGLEDWAAEIADKAPHNIKLVVVGNKVDLENERVVGSSTAEALARKLNAVDYVETSAQSGVGINELFTKIAELGEVPDPIGETPRPAPRHQEEESGGCC